jgi:hypothetical protein
MNLTQKVICYQAGQWTIGNILLHMRDICHGIMSSRRGWSESDIDDFFDILEPKLTRAVRRFVYRGVRFDSYLRRIFFFQARSYKARISEKRQLDSRIREIFEDRYQKISTGCGCVFETTPDTWPESVLPEPAAPARDPGAGGHAPLAGEELVSTVNEMMADKKSVLLASLKNCESWDDDIINTLSRFTGLPALSLLGLRQELMDVTRRKREKRNAVIQRRNSKFLHARRRDLNPDSVLQVVDSLKRTDRHLAKMQVRATHKDIAMVTGIPKGTVDSNLYSIQRRIKSANSVAVKAPHRKLLE